MGTSSLITIHPKWTYYYIPLMFYRAPRVVEVIGSLPQSNRKASWESGCSGPPCREGEGRVTKVVLRIFNARLKNQAESRRLTC